MKLRAMSAKKPIVLVDDDEDDHYLFAEICKKLEVGKEIRYFRGGAELLQYLRVTAEKPFIILCDINMPEMDGLSLRRQINSEEHLRRKSIPFVFFSTAATTEQITAAYELTVQGFFTKNHNFADAEATIRTILGYWASSRHPND